MKQKDMLLIVIVVIVSATLSVFLTKALISTPKNRQQEVEIVDPISIDFPTPDKKYFNEKSIDPTQLIKIGNSSNKTPFN